MGDATRLQQIVWNLLSNAIKFSRPDAVVTVEVERTFTHTRIVVRDEGVGIRREFLPHVFEAFRQAEASTTRTYGGLGLGLAIVKSLAELHGGSVVADSAGEGQGSTFCVTLPLVKSVHPAAMPAMSAAADLSGTSILVVDDDDDTRMMVATALRGRGGDVRTASSVAEARAMLVQARPDVVVTDIAMPQCDGYSLLEHLRLEANGLSGIPVIALTALGRPEDEARIRAAGVRAFARKPIEPGHLTDIVAASVAR
jgi:CheY-like chemotaxis protein